MPLVNVQGEQRSVLGRLLKGLTWRRVGYTFLVAAGLALWTGPGSWLLEKGGNPKLEIVGVRDFLVDRGWGLVFVFLIYLPVFFSQMLALTVADNLHVPRVPRWARLVLALVLGTSLGSAVVVWLTNDFFGVVAGRSLTWGGLIALAYFRRRRDAELATALHAAKLARMKQQKRALESDLQLMQAQVEPQFLFNTLKRIGDLFETDRSAADRMLENLIVYLRAALPQMRTSSSTLGREVALAQAYLDIERIRLRERFDFSFDVPRLLASATFPPMVLLPLIEAIALRAPNGSDYAGALRIEARSDSGDLELAIDHTGDGQPASDELEDIRTRLSALYGTGGKLEVGPLAPRGAIAKLRIPYVTA